MERLKLIVESRRVLVLTAKGIALDLASQTLAAALRALPVHWRLPFGYRPLLAESYTDPEAYAGTSDKASNWQSAGSSAGYRRHRADFYVAHDRPKRFRLRPLDPPARPQPMRRVIVVRSEVTVKKTGQTGAEPRYYLTSAEPKERPLAHRQELVRGHWAGVEIRHHWRRDAVWAKTVRARATPRPGQPRPAAQRALRVAARALSRDLPPRNPRATPLPSGQTWH